MNKKDPFQSREAEKYDHPIPSREYILEYLAEQGMPMSQAQIMQGLGLSLDQEEEALRRRLLAMVRDGQLHRNRRGLYGLVEKMDLIAGRVLGHKDGFGFVVPDDGSDDLFLSPRQMRAVFHGDRVLVQAIGIDSRGRREAVVIEVLEHNTLQIVGRFYTEAGASYVESANKRITQDVLIPPAAALGAESSQMVVVAITSQPTKQMRPIGKVIEILGSHMAPGMEIAVAIRNHDLPHIWPDDVLSEAARFADHVPEAVIADRVDLRHLPFVTIDGEDAKDFDDAVYATPQGKGWLLYVAIADVSYYVKPGNALDREALNRGNSVYFPEQVIPMLPEVLSNGLCSLKPLVDRLTQVCEMSISATGKITRYRFYEAVIHSHARLTYNQVYAMAVKQDKELQAHYKDLLPQIDNLFAIYYVLQKARQIRGTLDFDLPETKIVFGPERKIERIVLYERNDAHRVIEECMLAANICAAKFLLKRAYPALYRVHEGPTEEKLTDLRRFLSEVGVKMPGRRKQPAPKDYAEILQQVATRPDAHLIQMVLLRSLSQAVYSAENKGHFGLAYDAYAHFTSPIRRYPDLLVHRAIRSALNNETVLEEVANRLAGLGEHCSMTERRADEATRDVIDWLKCEFMSHKVGEEFEGTITNVTGFGFFVGLTDVYVEGLVHISNLPSDYYQFNPIQQALRGERSGRRFRVGDKVKIRVARVDLDQRQIDFLLAETIMPIKKVPLKRSLSPNKNKKRKRKR